MFYFHILEINFIFKSVQFHVIYKLISLNKQTKHNTNNTNSQTNKSMSSPAVGIDLGTTYSCVGIWVNDRVEIIPNDQGNRTTPSYVAFNKDERLIGDAAKNQVARNPKNTVFDAKRLIGRKFGDKIVQDDIKLWPFTVEKGTGEKPFIVVEFKGEKKKF